MKNKQLIHSLGIHLFRDEVCVVWRKKCWLESNRLEVKFWI